MSTEAPEATHNETNAPGSDSGDVAVDDVAVDDAAVDDTAVDTDKDAGRDADKPGTWLRMDNRTRTAFKAAKNHAHHSGHPGNGLKYAKWLRMGKYPQSFDLSTLEYGKWRHLVESDARATDSAGYRTNHPPFNGPKSGRDAWRAWAKSATDWPDSVINSLGRDELVNALRGAGLIAPE